jgi:hypothetical protein
MELILWIGTANLRIVLRQEKTKCILTEPYPDDLPTDSTNVDCIAHEKRCDDALNVSCLMLATMSLICRNSMSMWMLTL